MDGSHPGLGLAVGVRTTAVLPPGSRLRPSPTRRVAAFSMAAVVALGLAACSPSSAGEAPSAETTASAASTILVPDVVGLSLDKARDVLDAAGIPITSETDVRDGKMILMASNWTVVEQSGDATGVALGVEKPTETVAPPPTVSPTATVSPEPVPVAPAPVETAVEPTVAPPASVYFGSCADARAAGVTPLHSGDPGYRSGLDRDGDGTACE